MTVTIGLQNLSFEDPNAYKVLKMIYKILPTTDISVDYNKSVFR